MSDTRICPRHNATIPAEEPCPDCLTALQNAPDPETMTPDERQAECLSYFGAIQVAFPLIHERVEKLLRRPVWTHEFMYRDELAREARWDGPTSDMEDVLRRLPEKTPVIVVRVSPEEAAQ